MPGTTYNAVQDLRFNHQTPYGASILIGPALDITVSGISVQNLPYCCVQYNPRHANYYLDLYDCTLRANDSILSLWLTIARVRRVEVETSGRTTVRCHSSGILIDGLFVARASPVSSQIVDINGSSYGSYSFLNELQIDYEGSPFSGSNACGVFAEAAGATPSTTLEMHNCYFATVGAGNVGVRFRDLSPMTSADGPANFICSNVLLNDASEAATFEIDGPRWIAQIENMVLYGGTVLKHTGRYAGCRFQVHDRVTGGVPTAGAYVAGGHVFHVPSPGPGQVESYVCTAPGDFATATKPRFAPLTTVGANLP
jgi:hypothetical protein